ncbi:MAG: hypothetical protein IPI35_19695 [Deltaproteobacteria bacterium]|nr:hypothetical protein [Deltaproteobacteria bacterium]
MWVLILAGLAALTPFELPLLALGLNLVTFGLTLWSLARAEGADQPLPLGPCPSPRRSCSRPGLLPGARHHGP